jgi:hypothetical protein
VSPPRVQATKKHTFVFALPHYNPKSNGVHILYDLARMFAEAGHRVLATPHNGMNALKGAFGGSHHDFGFQSVTPSEVQPDWIPVFSDSSYPAFTEQFNTRFRVWYLLNKPYAMTGEGSRYRPEDLVVSYSKGLNGIYPSFFFNRVHPDLCNYFARRVPQSQKRHRISFYIGKSISTEIPIPVRRLVGKYNATIVILNRALPEEKAQLWRLLASSRLLVSTDPVTNLNYEATLLGTPCFITDNYTLTDYGAYEIPYLGVYTDSRFLDSTYNKGIIAEEQACIDKTLAVSISNHTETANEFLLRIDRHLDALQIADEDIEMKTQLQTINELRLENDKLRHEVLKLSSPLEPDLKAGFSLKPFLNVAARLKYLALRLQNLAMFAWLRLTTNAQVAAECFHKLESFRERSEKREARFRQVGQIRRL